MLVSRRGLNLTALNQVARSEVASHALSVEKAQSALPARFHFAAGVSSAIVRQLHNDGIHISTADGLPSRSSTPNHFNNKEGLGKT
jgi:hypothetical protein